MSLRIPAALAALLMLQPAAALGQSTTAPQAARTIEARVASLDAALEARRRELKIPGMAIAVVQGDRVLLLKGYGLSDIERGRPVTPDTIFALGSATKPMTATLLAMGVDEGRAHWAEHPRRHLPYFKLKDPAADRAVTLRHLLNHSSGLPRTDFAWQTGTLTREQVIRLAGRAEPTAKLGEAWQYQNVMYTAAGEIAGRLHGASWEGAIRRRLFQPLGMTRTRATYAEASVDPNLARGYLPGAEPKPAPRVDTDAVAGSGSVHSSARDMVRWLKFLIGEGSIDGKRLVSRENFAAMTTPGTAAGPSPYGLGWFLLERGGLKHVSHFGTISGFKAQVAFVPERDLAYVVLTNADRTPLISFAQLGPIDELILSSLLDAPAASPGPTAAAPTAGRAASPADPGRHPSLLGSYRLPDGSGTIELAARDGRLVLLTDGRALPLDEPANDQFHVGGLPAGYGITVRRRGDEVVGIAVITPGSTIEAARSEPYVAPMTAELLMQRMIEAAGGEQALRGKRAFRAGYTSELVNQGLKGQGVLLREAPGRFRSAVTYRAFGTCIASKWTYFDGAQGGETWSTRGPEPYKAAEPLRAVYAFNDLLEWRSLYSSVVIDWESEAAGEQTYVVKKTPHAGPPIIDYVSKATFRVVQRRLTVDGAPQVQTFDDFRQVGGVWTPFRRRIERPASDLGLEVIRLKDLSYFPNLPKVFNAPADPRCGGRLADAS